jgi:pimeloyl-ACP methyl ester carboxylesterase
MGAQFIGMRTALSTPCIFELGFEALNAIPDCRLLVFKDTRHWVPFEQPEEYAQAVVPFLRGYDVGVLKNEAAAVTAR